MVVRRDKPAGSPPDRPPAIVITAERLRTRIVVALFGRRLKLTYTMYNIFADLLLARRNPQLAGYASSRDYPVISRVEVCRLRKEIAKHFGRDFAMEVIQTGNSSEEYRLNPNVPDEEIVLDPSVSELPALSILTAEELADLRSRYRTLPERWEANGAAAPAADAEPPAPAPFPAAVRLARPRALTTTTTHLAALA
jgi:hypothetical protein